MPETFKKFLNYGLRGYQLNRMTVDVFSSLGENINTTLFIIISIVLDYGIKLFGF